MFRKSESKNAASPRRLSAGEGAISIIGPGMHVHGDITTDGSIRVEGSVEGSIRAEQGVVLGRGGEVRGNVYTREAVIGGRVLGTIVAESRLELQSTCVIEGDIQAPAQHLLIQEGASFNGQVQMGATPEPMRALPSASGAMEAAG